MSWTHFSDTLPKARKEYPCHLCGLPIAKGDKHCARRGACDGDVVTQRMHIACEKAADDWTMDDWETSIDHAAFRQMMKEHYSKEGGVTCE